MRLGSKSSKIRKFFCIVYLVILYLPYALVSAWQGDTISVAIAEEPITLNPFTARDVWSLKVISLLFDPLYGYGPGMELLPIIASEEPEIENETLRIRLKEGVLWSDGEPLTSHDVEFTFKALLALKPPHLSEPLSYLKSITAVDDLTVSMVIEPRGLVIVLEYLLTFPIVQRRQWEPLLRQALEKEKPSEWFSDKWPKPLASSGPFVLREWRPDALILERNDYYLHKPREVRRIILKVYRDVDDALLGMRAGEVDYIWWSLTPGYAEILAKEPMFKIVRSPSMRLYYIGFNLRNVPYNDLNFRRAIHELIDREFIVKYILRGYGREECSLVPYWSVKWHYNCSRVYDGDLAERIEKVRELLTKAGYRWINNTLIFKGRPIKEAVILVPSPFSDPYLYKIAMVVQEWLSRVGVKARVIVSSLERFIKEVFEKHEFDIFLYWIETTPYPDYLRTMFYSEFSAPGMANAFGYYSYEYDLLAEKVAGEVNLAKRRELILKMQELLARDIPCIPLLSPEMIEVHSGRFSGWISIPGGIGNRWSFLTIIRVK